MSLFDLSCSFITSPMKEKCSETADNSGFCKFHSNLKCSCGKDADFGCPNIGVIACGVPVCESCRWCNRHPNGVKGRER